MRVCVYVVGCERGHNPRRGPSGLDRGGWAGRRGPGLRRESGARPAAALRADGHTSPGGRHPALPPSCHSARRHAPCLLVRKARRRLASASSGRPSQPSAVSIPEACHTAQHPAQFLGPSRPRAPSQHAQGPGRSSAPLGSFLCPPELCCPPHQAPPKHRAPPQTPSSRGVSPSPLPLPSESGVRAGGPGGEAANQLGDPDCIFLTNVKHPRAAICSNGKNQQVPGV